MQMENLLARRREIEISKKSALMTHLNTSVGVGVAVAELQGDSNWHIYASHVEALRQNYEQQARGYEQSLLGAEFLEPKQYGQLKIKLAESKGMAKGLALALDLAKTLIQRGEKAAKELADISKPPDLKV